MAQANHHLPVKCMILWLGNSAGLFCSQLGSFTLQPSAARQLNGSASEGRLAVIRVMGVTEPCVSLHPAGQPWLVDTAAGQGSKRISESMQGL